jgi:hypothetical protein
MSDISPLRQVLDETIADAKIVGLKLSMDALTVMSSANDPFRLDTRAGHRDGKWLADLMHSLGVGRIHLRGLHYVLLKQTKPDGSMYVNDDACWEWLANGPAKAGRWLGYIPFDQLTDQRNAAPVVRIFEPSVPWPYLSVGLNIEIPDADNLEPYVGVAHFEGTQPYKLVMVGEKSSLDVVLGPIAQRYEADLYLPTGDISDTMIYQMARIGAEDGRPMRVFYFADADPSGWNMGIALSRKLQALGVLHFPGLDVQVRRVALVPDQVREFGLPSTPLKATERRADKWREKMLVEQTEIDALATLRPDLLRTLARGALAPFYDSTLAQRARNAYSEWRREAQAIVDAGTDQAMLDRIRGQARAKLAELRTEIDTINDAMRMDIDDFDLPEIVIPGPDPSLGVTADEPLFDSEWGFAEQTRRLIDSKAYRDGE